MDSKLEIVQTNGPFLWEIRFGQPQDDTGFDSLIAPGYFVYGYLTPMNRSFPFA